MHRAEYRFGTTGTLDGSQTHEWFYKDYSGRYIKSLPLNNYRITILLPRSLSGDSFFHMDESYVKLSGKKTYQEEIDFIVGHEKRNKFIRNPSHWISKEILWCYLIMLTNMVTPLHNLIREKSKDRKVYFVSGETNTSDRENNTRNRRGNG